MLYIIAYAVAGQQLHQINSGLERAIAPEVFEINLTKNYPL
jgi:hypothetical protein